MRIEFSKGRFRKMMMLREAMTSALQRRWIELKKARGFDTPSELTINEGPKRLSINTIADAADNTTPFYTNNVVPIFTSASTERFIPNHSGLVFRQGDDGIGETGPKARSKNISASTCEGASLHIKQPVSSCRLAPDHGKADAWGDANGPEPCADVGITSGAISTGPDDSIPRLS